MSSETLRQTELPERSAPAAPAARETGSPARTTVCQVLHSLDVGGAEVLADRLARGLQNEFRFVFACLDEIGPLGAALRDEGFVVERLDRRPGFDWRCARRLARFCKRQAVDVVHAHQYTPFFYSLAARLSGSGRPIVFTEHGRHQPDYPRRKRILFNRLMLRRRDRVFAVGEAVRQALIVNEGLPEARVGVIYNGIDLSPYDGNFDRAAKRAEFGFAPDDFVITQVGRLDYLKDHPTALRTIERLVADVPRAKLLVVGEGAERAKIEAEIDARNLRAHVVLAGLRRDVPALLSASDAFLLTSLSEGIPLTLIEAMVAGLPVVSTDVGGIREVLGEEADDCLAPAEDDETLAMRLRAAMENDAATADRIERRRIRANDLFAESRMHAEYSSAFLALSRGPSNRLSRP